MQLQTLGIAALKLASLLSGQHRVQSDLSIAHQCIYYQPAGPACRPPDKAGCTLQVHARQQGGNQKVVSQALSELLWRDFFRLTSKKYASLPLDRQRCRTTAGIDATAGAACTPAMHAPQPVHQLAYA